MSNPASAVERVLLLHFELVYNEFAQYGAPGGTPIEVTNGYC
jgi:hypothetical protein